MTTRSPTPPESSCIYYYKDKPIVLMEPEEIYERMRIELRDAREVLAARESCLTDPVLYQKYVSLPYARGHKILAEIMFASRHQFEALDKAGRTTKNMTIQDWRQLELPFTLITVINSRDVFVMGLPYESSPQAEIMQVGEKASSLRKQQYKQLIHRLVDSTPCIHIQKLWMVDKGSRCLEAFNLLDEVLFVSALVLAMELIADSSRVCDTFKDMKEWVKNEIEKMDISLPVEGRRKRRRDNKEYEP